MASSLVHECGTSLAMTRQRTFARHTDTCHRRLSMKTAKTHAVALVVSCILLGALAVARQAAAQCVPDPPSGSIIVPNCGGFAARPAPQPQAPVATVAGVPLPTFLRNPVVTAVS